MIKVLSRETPKLPFFIMVYPNGNKAYIVHNNMSEPISARAAWQLRDDLGMNSTDYPEPHEEK
jgi:hypothetical protein